MAATEASTIDATMPNQWCATCNRRTPRTYLNNGSYGCITCNPTRQAFKGLPPITKRPPTPTEEIGEIPDWMC